MAVKEKGAIRLDKADGLLAKHNGIAGTVKPYREEADDNNYLVSLRKYKNQL